MRLPQIRCTWVPLMVTAMYSGGLPTSPMRLSPAMRGCSSMITERSLRVTRTGRSVEIPDRGRCFHAAQPVDQGEGRKLQQKAGSTQGTSCKERMG